MTFLYYFIKIVKQLLPGHHFIFLTIILSVICFKKNCKNPNEVVPNVDSI